MMDTTDKYLREIEQSLEMEGLKKGSFAYDAELRRRKVDLCKQRQNVDSCWNCKYFDHCGLVKLHLLDLRYHTKKPDGT